jgi:hypothetical protein
MYYELYHLQAGNVQALDTTLHSIESFENINS